MKEAERRLLERIMESPHFAQASSLKRTLAYLCERPDENGANLPKEYEIAVQALSRPASFDPKTDPIVRVNVAAIRQRLLAYFESEGREETLRLEIPKGVYRAVFSAHSAGRAALETAETTMAARRKFWQPYLSGNAKNMLVYTDVLFFRDDSGNYLRNIYVNGLPGGAEEIQERAPAKAFHGLKPSYHFTSAGEVQSMLALIWLFARLKAPLEVRNSRFTSWNEMRSSNLILLGSSRTNAFLDALQSGNNFVITDDAIRNTAPREGEEPSYSGQRHMEGKLEKAVEPAVVTRRPGLAPGTVVTMIAANHGRGVEGAAQFLTLEGDVAAALKSSGLDNTGKLPAHFQWLLRVHMVDFDEEVISVECASHRIISTTPSCKGTEAVTRDSRQDFTIFNPLLLRGSKSLP
jgi:hypothetical protein